MKNKQIVTLISVSLVLLYTCLIVAWHFYVPDSNLKIQAPGADNRPEGSTRAANDVVIGQFFMAYDTIDSELTGKWTNLRGADYSNIVKTDREIKVDGDDYPILWGVETGEGHAAPVIYNGKVYFLDYNEELSSDALRCFSLETGDELWRRWYRMPIKRNHGFSRTIPYVNDSVVVSIGPEGHVMVCNPTNGELRWTLDMQKEFKTEVPFWYTGQCPLVVNNELILAPAGEDALLVAYDVITGEKLWETPNEVNFKMSHSSVMPMKLLNKETYVYIGVGGICGVSAEGENKGKLIWYNTKWQPSVVAPSPVQINNNTIFMVAGYGSGGAKLVLNNSNGAWSTKVTDQYKPNSGISSEQQTPILLDNKLISIMPKDGGINRSKLVYYSTNDLHKPIWTSSSDERFGLGPYIIINDDLFIFNDDGELFVYQIDNNSMKQIKRQQIIEDGFDAWGPMAYADGMLLVRDGHNIKCVKIGV